MNELLNLFENNFEQMFTPYNREDILRNPWKDGWGQGFEAEDARFLEKYLGDDYVYITTNKFFNQKDLEQFLSDLSISRYLGRTQAGADDMSAYKVNDVPVVLIWWHGQIIELHVAKENQQKLIDIYLEWDNERSSK